MPRMSGAGLKITACGIGNQGPEAIDRTCEPERRKPLHNDFLLLSWLRRGYVDRVRVRCVFVLYRGTIIVIGESRKDGPESGYELHIEIRCSR